MDHIRKNNIDLSQYLVGILEDEGVSHIFGIPGEQITPMYRALADSSIKHILVKHEQSAVHAAEGYARSGDRIGVCMATAGPGALNFTMALATAYKDNIPILVLTADNDLNLKNTSHFQSVNIPEIFKPITQESFNPSNGSEAIFMLRVALYALKNNPAGPIHINLSRDLLLSSDFEDFGICPLCENDLSGVRDAQNLISTSQKPLFLLGSGAIICRKEIESIARENEIPIVTTFNARGIISELDDLNLGMVGIRGTPQGNYAIENADCVIALGSRLSERTLKNTPENLIHVLNNKELLTGDCQVYGRVGDFLNEIKFKKSGWLGEILEINNGIDVEGCDADFKPQSAIKRILKKFPDNLVVGDAGSHITWLTLLMQAKRPQQLIFSGGFAPMGYAIPAAIGAAVATGEKIIVICGDGDFQMNMQELATIVENNLDIVIFIINNSQYAIIKQWQEDIYNMDPYEVFYKNPDFLKISGAYGIDSIRIDSLDDFEEFLNTDFDYPFLVDVFVDFEPIPLPK